MDRKFAAVIFAMLVPSLSGAEEGEKEEKKGVAPSPYALIVEPKFMGAKHFVLLPKSKETGLVPAKWDGKRLVAYTKSEYRALEMPWNRFLALATKTAEEQVEFLEAKFYRGKNEVITHAVVESPSPLLPSVIVSPAFRKKFAEKMGAEFFVAVPDRSTIVILPKSGAALGEVEEVVTDLFDVAAYPVSLELIEIKKDGIRAVGKFGGN